MPGSSCDGKSAPATAFTLDMQLPHFPPPPPPPPPLPPPWSLQNTTIRIEAEIAASSSAPGCRTNGAVSGYGALAARSVTRTRTRSMSPCPDQTLTTTVTLPSSAASVTLISLAPPTDARTTAGDQLPLPLPPTMMPLPTVLKAAATETAAKTTAMVLPLPSLLPMPSPLHHLAPQPTQRAQLSLLDSATLSNLQRSEHSQPPRLQAPLNRTTVKQCISSQTCGVNQPMMEHAKLLPLSPSSSSSRETRV